MPVFHLRPRLLPLVAAVAVSLVSVVTVAEPYQQVIAEAFDSRKRQLLYTEHHQLDHTGMQHQVQYRCPEGRLLASKSLDYSAGTFAPSFTMSFETHDLEYGAQRQEGSEQHEAATTHLTLFNRPAAENDQLRVTHQQQLSWDKPSPLVIDGGINHFIVEHFDTLAAGTPVSFDFGLSLRLSTVKLQLERVSPKQLPVKLQDYSVNADTSAIFRAQAKNWLVRQLAPEIFFVYDIALRDPVLFYGPSNLLNQEGQADQVVIRFRELSESEKEKAALIAASETNFETADAL
ncbi:hypothetical protein R50073_10090 [Maricurvus nonylphenolicus]|uniref:hypothetical protein n=1 Tax=Maricurvus nonylphenolicus TaxID=1008307 RepID=UPI0036F30837